MFCYSHKTTRLFEPKFSPHQIVFHTRPQIPLFFFLNVSRDSLKNCIVSYCATRPSHTHHSDQYLISQSRFTFTS